MSSVSVEYILIRVIESDTIKEMSQEIINNLLDLPESQEFDCKRAEIQPSKVLKTVCAFVNSQGGVIALGVDDPRKVSREKRIVGIGAQEPLLSELLNLVKKEFDPPLVREIEMRKIATGNLHGKRDHIALLRIPKSPDIHSLKNGNTFIRRGSSNYRIGVSEITRLRYEKGTLKYENEPATDVPFSALNHDLLNQYKEDVGSLEMNDREFLKDNGLAVKRGRQTVLTKAGVLLFAKNPAVVLKSKCSVKVSHYYGKTRNYSGEPNFVTRPFTIEGPLLQQIEQTLNYYQGVASASPPKLIGAKFFPSLLIPEWAFQEAVTNAVIHRNYYIEDDIQIEYLTIVLKLPAPALIPDILHRRILGAKDLLVM